MIQTFLIWWLPVRRSCWNCATHKCKMRVPQWQLLLLLTKRRARPCLRPLKQSRATSAALSNQLSSARWGPWYRARGCCSQRAPQLRALHSRKGQGPSVAKPARPCSLRGRGLWVCLGGSGCATAPRCAGVRVLHGRGLPAARRGGGGGVLIATKKQSDVGVANLGSYPLDCPLCPKLALGRGYVFGLV